MLTMSPDNLTSTTLRKSIHNPSNFKSSKEEQTQNVAEISNSSIDGNNNLNMNGSIHVHKSAHQDIIQNQASSSSAANESSPNRLGGDMLLQWGQRKRSRCSRTEGRSMVMPPPHPSTSNCGASSSSNGSRNGGSSRNRPHGLLYGKDSPAFLSSKNRTLVDQMGTTNNGSPSRNNGNGSGSTSSRPISRSTVGKRSSCIDKSEKKIYSSSIRKVKSDDSIVGNGTKNGELGQGEQHHLHHHDQMVRSPVAEAEKGSEIIEWPRIYLSLSRKEKEDDFYAMKGTKLPHRPKKRAKAVDRALQYCFPGLWLSDLTRARYEVRERKSSKKQPKRRGLKGLETIESESE
ncbi:uncharacterized protein LOC130827678 isoform X1 [Amaranthus tricolor]|uniref:uncharacterized protein LOC130827678 isoform X1 n=1 Tax=Amaranthus tricolor TaxID=29722 RepID=UPI0025836A52|nr:uncharacterized protein LOC130827678 isoform X1 [Amaranthus tricolor]